MYVTSAGIHQGKIDLKYGKYGNDFVGDMPSLSLPFTIMDAPKGAQSFALILDDQEAQVVAGFVWIHWLAANIQTMEVSEGASKGQKNKAFVEGENSWGICQYGGMAPPNKPHRYDLTVYALDTILPLKQGFCQDELLSKMEGHILAIAQISGIYPN